MLQTVLSEYDQNDAHTEVCLRVLDYMTHIPVEIHNINRKHDLSIER